MISFEEKVKVILEWFENASLKDKIAFKSTPREDLVRYHDSLGRNIRNHFKLWEDKWEPDIRDGVDYSPNHPDAISMLLIEAVWDKCQTKPAH